MTVAPELAGGRSVTAETVPLADNIHKALGLCSANANIFAATSCKGKLLFLFPLTSANHARYQMFNSSSNAFGMN